MTLIEKIENLKDLLDSFNERLLLGLESTGCKLDRFYYRCSSGFTDFVKHPVETFKQLYIDFFKYFKH